MKKSILTICMLVTIGIFFCSAAEAKWWIFGKTEGIVETRYVYLNGISYDELGPQVILYRDMLSGGMISIKGRATAAKRNVGAVQVSTNNQETWQTAKLATDGTFEFSFTPDPGKTYVIFLKIIDTTGKANDVEATRKEVTVSQESIQAIIKEALDKLITAYRDEDPNRFMALVSEDFAGDETNLDRAVRDDFRAFDNIDLRYTLNNVSSNAQGRIFVMITYNRMVTSSRSGESFTDKGMTEFTFVLGDKGPKVYSMKYPLIFGLSDVESVATGVTPQTGNDTIIVVDGQGNVTEVPFSEALKDDTSGNTVEEGYNLTTVYGGGGSMNGPGGFTFADADTNAGPDGDFMITGYHEPPSEAYGWLNNGVMIADLGMQSLNDVYEAPESGYDTYTAPPGGAIYLTEGHCYAFRLADQTYGLLYVRSVTDEIIAEPYYSETITMRFDYKYQTDGSRNF